MAHDAAWRRLGVLVSAAIAIAPLMLQPMAAAASGTGTLFGVAGHQDILS
jgi:hypothetical protein